MIAKGEDVGGLGFEVSQQHLRGGHLLLGGLRGEPEMARGRDAGEAASPQVGALLASFLASYRLLVYRLFN